MIKFDVARGHSFFLWGQRQTGKTTLLRQKFPESHVIDLLKNDVFVKYAQNPSLLREELRAIPRSGPIVIDEVQKVPPLLDEVHWLIENKRLQFALCGSSARKLKRGHANLLGGRAIRFELFGLVSAELDKGLDLSRLLNRGYLPPHYTSDVYRELLRSYVVDYLKEEITEEGLVRSLPTFARFLDLAALSDTELVSYSTFGRDCGISPNTVQEYYQILVDTLIGGYLPAFSKRTKRRVSKTPKFYFHDVGIVNHLARRGEIQEGTPYFGKSFENWLHHELYSYSIYSRKFLEMCYWQVGKLGEVDFVIDGGKIAIEAKGTDRITSDHLRGIRSFASEFKRAKKLVVCCEKQARMTDDGIEILPWREFASQLWSGGVI